MPLSQGSSREAFSSNVKAELEAGKPQAQAVAIAYREARGATLKRVAADARRHHGVTLRGKVETWPAKRNPSMGTPGARRMDRESKAGIRKVAREMDPAQRTGWIANLKNEIASAQDSGKKKLLTQSLRIVDSVHSPRKSAGKEEREAKRRADRRTAEDKAEVEREKLRTCESQIAQHQRAVENAKKEIVKLRADCKKHRAEAKKQEAKARPLS